MKYIAYCTKGLEKIVQKEIKHRLEDSIFEEVSTKRLIFKSESKFSDIEKLRTVDDLGVFIGKLELNEPKRSDYRLLIEEIGKFDFLMAVREIQEFRCIRPKEFSLTLGAVGIKDFTISDLRSSLVKNIGNRLGWRFNELDNSNFDIRVFIDSNHVFISARLTKRPLHRRKYKKESKAGSLKPTIAAAMVLMAAKGKRRLKIVDNCCGSGTILCEARVMGNQVFGGDIDKESVQITKNNLLNLQYKRLEDIKQLDCTRTKWPGNSFDCAISNLPYGKQVKVGRITSLYRDCLRECVRIVKHGGKICLLGIKPEIIRKYAKKFIRNVRVKELKLGFLGQNPSLVVVSILR